jgi:xanthine dehydrogenase accessory factor
VSTASGGVLAEAGRMAAAGEPFALATVVDVRRPASARRGDRAIVRSDGAVLGWVGGACSEPIVVREALRALADEMPRLVRITPPGRAGEAPPGVVVAESTCASEGTVDVLVEPQLPTPLLAVVGDSPAARALGDLARTIGWRVTAEPTGAADAIVVATMGRGDEDALQIALESGTGYVGLVASSRRAAAVLAALRERDVDEEALASVRSPAGLDLGPSTQEEIAVAILAELVAWRHTRRDAAAPLGEAVDPVCGTTVSTSGAAATAVHDGGTYYFCCPGCRGRFERNPEKFLAARA